MERKALSQAEHEKINAQESPGTRELCVGCDEPTGRAGPGDGSLYIDGEGPLCEDCYGDRSREDKEPGGMEPPEFQVGEVVLIQSEGDVGVIKYVNETDTGGWSYTVEYCQGKDLATGPRGGYGSVWREGYPQAVQEPADILFAEALYVRREIKQREKELEKLRADFEALRRSRDLLLKKHKGGEADES